MKTKYTVNPSQEIAKSLSKSISGDERVSKVAVKVALLKSLPRESNINRIFKEKKKRLGKQPENTESYMFKFGEFISEDIMKDLKKISKSKKDSEISLDDGSAIPIDPLTSQILIKYIEGLSSSEKNRTIQQIQRTERAFMKVLGKAHESI